MGIGITTKLLCCSIVFSVISLQLLLLWNSFGKCFFCESIVSCNLYWFAGEHQTMHIFCALVSSSFGHLLWPAVDRLPIIVGCCNEISMKKTSQITHQNDRKLHEQIFEQSEWNGTRVCLRLRFSLYVQFFYTDRMLTISPDSRRRGYKGTTKNTTYTNYNRNGKQQW